MIADPEFFYKDEYLKYIGWMCSDHDSTVRREAVKSVLKVVSTNTDSEDVLSFVEVCFFLLLIRKYSYVFYVIAFLPSISLGALSKSLWVISMRTRSLR